MKPCESCQQPLPPATSRRRFCNDRCRKAAASKRRSQGRVVPEFARKQIRELEHQLQVAQQNISTMEKNLEDRSQRLDQRDRKLDQLKYQLKRAEEKARAEVAAASGREAAARTRTVQVQHQVQRIQTARDRAQEERDKARTEVDSLLDSVQRLRDRVQQVEADRDQLVQDLTRAVQRVQGWTALLAYAQGVTEDLEILVSELHAPIEEDWQQYLHGWTGVVHERLERFEVFQDAAQLSPEQEAQSLVLAQDQVVGSRTGTGRW